jgi:hypothetical protein
VWCTSPSLTLSLTLSHFLSHSLTLSLSHSRSLALSLSLSCLHGVNVFVVVAVLLIEIASAVIVFLCRNEVSEGGNAPVETVYPVPAPIPAPVSFDAVVRQLLLALMPPRG